MAMAAAVVGAASPSTTFMVDFCFYFGVCLVLIGLFRWLFELMLQPSSPNKESKVNGAAHKIKGHGADVSGVAQASDDGTPEDAPHSIASGFLEPPPQDTESKRAVCGLFPSGGSALTVEQFGASLQRMMRACHKQHDQPRLRIFDDQTVSDQMDGNTVTLTECRCTQFRRLRVAAHLSEEAYMASMCAKPFSGGKVEASGKSGSFFLRSHDSKFVLKTIEEHEFEVLKDVLPHMVLYLQEHQRSLLCRFLGGYCLQIAGKTLRFVVMANVLPRHADEVYDLKGTTEDRWVDPATRGVMKDNNFHSQSMLFDSALCSELTQQIRDDAEFLYSLGVMDYSLLVGISPPPTGEGLEHNQHDGLTLACGWLAVAGGHTKPKLFQMGIIDYLQRWTSKKVAAHWLKKSTLGCFHEIDTEPPAVYCKRFYKYFFNKIQIISR